MAGNAIVGGITAAIHARAGGKPVAYAAVAGVLGGTIHGSGKAIASGFTWSGLAIGALGTSIVANAGRGAPPLETLVMPLGPARIRVTRDTSTRVRLAINLYETTALVSQATRPGRRIDWAQSFASGTFVLRTAGVLPVSGGRRAAGLTTGSVVTISDRASHPDRTLDHERVHVQQTWFFHEVWSRPIESSLRARSSWLRRIPTWLELGAFTPAVLSAERRTAGVDGPFRTLRESEAESFEDK